MRRLLRKRCVRATLPMIIALVGAVGAFAYFTSHGSDAATAPVGTLSAPGQPVRSGPGNRVDLTWTASAGGSGSIAYHVERSTSPVTTWSNACGTTALSGTTATSCTDAPGNGTFVYRVTALYHSWTKTGPQSDAFAVDATAPVVSSINRADSTPTNTASVHWSVAFSKSVTGVDASDFTLAGATSGASITGVSGSGASYTVSVSTGSDGTLGVNLVDDDSITDSASNTLGGTGAGNGNFTGQTYTVDKTAPNGGALTVNGTSASGAGTSSFNGTGSFTIGTRTDYTDAGSGLATSTLTRRSGTLTSSNGILGGTCGTFGSSTTISGNPSQTLTGPTCYLYTLTGTDNAGNAASISTIVKVDTTAPSAPTVSPSAATGNTFVSGSSVYTNPQAGKSGTFTVGATTIDNDSGIQKVSFPSLTGFTSGGGDDTSSLYSTTYAWSGAGATASGSQTVSAVNNASLSATSSFTVTPDTAAPSGGSVGATGLVGTGTLYSTSTTLSILLNKGSDTGSGLATSGAQLLRAAATLSGGTCGTYGSFSQVGSNDPSSPYADNAAGGITSGNCYRYQYVVPDNVGNAVTYTSGDVKVDTTAPTFTVTTTGGAYWNGTQFYFDSAVAGTFTITAADPESGLGSAALAAAPTSWSKTGTNPATYTRTGTASSTLASSSASNNAGATGTMASTAITVDTTNPTNSLTLGSANGAYMAAANGVLFYKSNAPGSFTLVNAVGDAGSGPASATFPAVAATNWAHPADLITTPSGGPYTSSTYSWIATAGAPTAGERAFSSKDNVGNPSANTTLTFTVDNTNATGAITFPLTATAFYSPSTWTGSIAGTATDSTGSGVGTVKISIRDTTNSTCADANGAFTVTGCTTTNFVTVSGTTSWTFAEAAANLTTGHGYSVTLETIDNVGNVNAAADTETFTYDATAPTGSITAPSAGAIVSGSLTVSSNSADTGSGVASAQFQYSVNGANSWTTIGTDTTSPYSVNLDTTSLAAGSYDLRVITTDNVGNTFTSSTVTVTVGSSVAAEAFGSTGTTVTSSSFTLSANTTYLVYAYNHSTGTSLDSASIGSTIAGTTFTSVGSQQSYDGNVATNWVWTLSGSSTGTGTVTVTFGKTTSESAIEVVKLAGNDTSTPVVTANEGFATSTGTTTSNPGTANLPNAPGSGNFEVVFFSSPDDTKATAPISSSAGILNLAYGHKFGGANSCDGVYAGPAVQTESLNFNGTAVHWGTIALEIKHA